MRIFSLFCTLLGLICGVLPLCCGAGNATAQVRETYTAIQQNVMKSYKLCVQNPEPAAIVEVLKRNDAVCKNILAVSDAPADFKKALYAYVDEYRFVAAIIILRNTHAQQLTPDEVKRVKAWDKQAEQVLRLAEKYGFSPESAALPSSKKRIAPQP